MPALDCHMLQAKIAADEDISGIDFSNCRPNCKGMILQALIRRQRDTGEDLSRYISIVESLTTTLD